MAKKMSDLSIGGLTLLQQVGAGGLVASIVVAGLCAILLLATGNERDRRQAALASDEVRSARVAGASDALPEQARLRREAKAARNEAAAARAAAEEAEAEAARLAAVNASLERRLGLGPLAQNAGAENVGAGTASALPDLPASVLAPDVLAALRPENARRLAKTQVDALTADLEGHAGDFSVEVTSAPDEEARLYAAQLAQAFRQAGIPTQGPYGVLTTLKGDGVFVSTEGPLGDAPGTTVLSALQNASLPAQPAPNDPESATFLLPETTDVRVYVGGAPGA